MPEALKVLGQLDCPATTLTVLYTVPAVTQAVISSIVITERDGTSNTYRIAVSVAGAAINDKQYIAYDVPILPNANEAEVIGLTLGAGDIIRVYAGATGLSFNAFGVEVT